MVMAFGVEESPVEDVTYEAVWEAPQQFLALQKGEENGKNQVADCILQDESNV